MIGPEGESILLTNNLTNSMLVLPTFELEVSLSLESEEGVDTLDRIIQLKLKSAVIERLRECRYAALGQLGVREQDLIEDVHLKVFLVLHEASSAEYKCEGGKATGTQELGIAALTWFPSELGETPAVEYHCAVLD